MQEACNFKAKIERIESDLIVTARRVARIVSLLLSQIINSIYWFKKIPRRIKTILIVRLQQLGDAVLSLPAIDEIYAKNPKAMLTFLVPQGVATLFRKKYPLARFEIYASPRFYRGDPTNWMVRWQMLTHLIRQNFDLVIDFDGDWFTLFYALLGYYGYRLDRGRYRLSPEGRKFRHQVMVNLGIVSSQVNVSTCFPKVELPNFLDGELSFNNKQGKIKINFSQPYVVLHPGAGLNIKRWAPERWVELCLWLYYCGYTQIITIGSKNEQNVSEQIMKSAAVNILNFTGLTMITEMVSLIKRAALFIGSDSFPGHVAAASQVPTVMLFGPQTPEYFALPYTNVQCVYLQTRCSPCQYNNMYVDYCPRNNECMGQITLEKVTEAVMRVLPKKANKAK